MSIGSIARKVFGRHFEVIGNVYRRFFVDLDAVAAALDPLIPTNSAVLDVGGGDGALVERILRRRSDIKVTMCDLAPSIGSFLSEENRTNVRLLPATDLSDVHGRFDIVMVADVIHHIPPDRRASFFTSLASGRERWGCKKIILKDVEPGSFRALLSVLADRYITGDRHVVLFSRAHFAEMATRLFPNARRASGMLDELNYYEVLAW